MNEMKLINANFMILYNKRFYQYELFLLIRLENKSTINNGVASTRQSCLAVSKLAMSNKGF